MPLEAELPRREYPVVIEPLSEEDGGGFLASAPDLPGCMSDGQTREEAARNIDDAIRAWIEEAKLMGRAVPEPSIHLAMAGE
jgi:antitoxin HicB